MFSIETRDLAVDLAIGGAFLQIGAFVACDFTLRDSELGLQFPIFPMQVDNDKSTTSNLGFAVKFIGFRAVEQKFSDALGGGDVVTGALVRLDVSVVEKRLTILNPGESVTYV